jgi:hypothetical protein
MTEAHEVTRTLTESIWYPPHSARKSSTEYKRVHKHLVYELDEPCWICGVRQSQLPARQFMETHHWHIEWALANGVDPMLVAKDFRHAVEEGPFESDSAWLRHWLDSEGNMLVLCSAHHRSGLTGIHMITYPAWCAQRWLSDGHDISQGAAAL